MRDLHTVLISGYAKLPASTTAEIVYNMLVVAVVFDDRTSVIIDAEASLVTNLGRSFVKDVLVGKELEDGPECIIEELEGHYFGNAKKALETAVRMVFVHYQEYKERKV